MIENDSENIIDAKIDWFTVVVFLVLLTFGWVSVYSSSYDGEDARFYDFNYRYGMQLIWIVISLLISFMIMLVDVKYFKRYSYLIYGITLLLMILTLLIGKEVNGSKSWLGIGSFGLQSVEFMKIGTAFAVASIINLTDFTIKSFRSIFYFSLALIAPIILSLLQNDTGSAMVFAAFTIVLYREGLSYHLYLFALIVALLFVGSFLIDRLVLIVIIFIFSLLMFAIINKDFKNLSRYLSALVLFTLVLYSVLYVLDVNNAFNISLLAAAGMTLPACIIYKKIKFKYKVWSIVGLCVFMLSFTYVVDYSFDNVLKPHQRVRILNLFGIQNDPRGTSYNVTQSKIAIGSGGLTGKGFLQGTQTQYSYVPEQETDFIFCTVGEEEGFVGTASVIILFTILIIRLLVMGERAEDSFVRGFCYSVAGIFMFHFVINIAMTVGLFPVIGIPLPFFSYGGSSLLAFSIMLAVAVRLDSKRILDKF